jgi:hypothetical protein
VRGCGSPTDRFGSFAPDDTPTDGHGMSALPPIATELLRRTELTLRAKRRHMPCSNFGIGAGSLLRVLVAIRQAAAP